MDARYRSMPQSYQPGRGQKTPWSPGLLRRFPWPGVGALTFSMVCLAASSIVLIYSNNKPISDWKFQPTVYLAIFSALTNIFLLFSFTESANIAWWKKASAPGTSVSDLHRCWQHGTSLASAVFSGRHFTLVALACIMATLAQINGPLFQRASQPAVVSMSSETTLALSLATKFPAHNTGYLSGRQYAVSLFTADYTPIVDAFNSNRSISISKESGCSANGRCAATVTGVGLSVNCSSYSQAFNLNETADTSDAAYQGWNVFEAILNWTASNPGNITLRSSYKGTDKCYGNLIVQECTLQPATVRYAIVIDGNSSSIALDPSTTVFDDVVQEKNNINDALIQGSTTLGGYFLALKNRFTSTAHLRFAGAVGFELLTTGNIATQYAVVNASIGTEGTQSAIPAQSCHLFFRDPMPDLLASARELMFRSSVAFGALNKATPVQRVTASQSEQRTVYRSNYYYLAGAVIVTILAAIMIGCVLHGYSELGRRMSNSPIEIAKAFNAPLLRSEDGNAPIDDLIKEVGYRSVRYGAVAASSPLPSSGHAYTPLKYGVSQVSTAESPETTSTSTRLEMADETVVQVPRKGWTFVGY